MKHILKLAMIVTFIFASQTVQAAVDLNRLAALTFLRKCRAGEYDDPRSGYKNSNDCTAAPIFWKNIPNLNGHQDLLDKVSKGELDDTELQATDEEREKALQAVEDFIREGNELRAKYAQAAKEEL